MLKDGTPDREIIELHPAISFHLDQLDTMQLFRTPPPTKASPIRWFGSIPEAARCTSTGVRRTRWIWGGPATGKTQWAIQQLGGEAVVIRRRDQLAGLRFYHARARGDPTTFPPVVFYFDVDVDVKEVVAFQKEFRTRGIRHIFVCRSCLLRLGIGLGLSLASPHVARKFDFDAISVNELIKTTQHGAVCGEA